MKRIGVVGGTCSPPHLGHRHLATQAMRQAKRDEVIIMPSYMPPHKDAPELVSGTTRLTLCGMTFSDTHFRISDLEIRRGGKSYTVETMRTLHNLYPRDELYLIIGSDMLLSFDSWYCADEILSLCTLLVLSRENVLAPETLREYAVRTLGLTEGVGFMILETTPIVLSSTEIRRAIAAGEDVSASLSDEAYEYINDKGLYLDD